jgi:replicative DNA helicase
MVDLLADLRKIELPFDIDKVDSMCHECVRQQLEKYNGYIDDKGISYSGKFVVPCSGVPKNIRGNEEIKKLFDDESWEEFVASTNSPEFAASKLKLPNKTPWIAREYQEKTLKCTARRRVLRWSRRTGKTDAISIEIVYQMFSNDGVKVVLIAPHKPQVEEIVNRVKGFIHSNPLLYSCVTRDRAAPFYELVITNGSRLRGFAVGSSGGNEGVTVRGQDADYIYIEEMSYVDDSALDGAVLPILQTSPDTYLIGFSTPTGAKDMFHDFCKNSPEYKEFHYSYRVLPWYKNVEADRHRYTEIKWLTEFEAEFPSPEDGVYRTSYVDRAQREYKYEDMLYDYRWRYVIGTDWNEVHGTEIVVVGWNIAAKRFQIVDAVCVEKSEFTQLRGIAKLVEMTKKWRPSFIYIDAGGGGSTNYEVLRKTSMEARRPGGDKEVAKLLDILKKYDSGASIEARDPVSGKMEKYPAKQFMVSASVRMFEQDIIRISVADQTLVSQLHNYIIKRITPTGNPVYDTREPSIGDHRLDALNLALVAIHLEFGDLHMTNLVTKALPVPGPRTMRNNMERSTLSSEDGHGSPEDRRLLDSSTDTSTIMLPGRVAGIKRKSTRPGWAHDEEDKVMARIAQRRRGRSRAGNNLPRRDNF